MCVVIYYIHFCVVTVTSVCEVMEPGSPSLLWPLRLNKPSGLTMPGSGEPEKPAEERAQSPALADRLAAAPSPSTSPVPTFTPEPHQFKAALVADKYLLLEQVEGSSLCKCVDVRTEEEYVCKVSNVAYRDILFILLCI